MSRALLVGKMTLGYYNWCNLSIGDGLGSHVSSLTQLDVGQMLLKCEVYLLDIIVTVSSSKHDFY